MTWLLPDASIIPAGGVVRDVIVPQRRGSEASQPDRQPEHVLKQRREEYARHLEARRAAAREHYHRNREKNAAAARERQKARRAK